MTLLTMLGKSKLKELEDAVETDLSPEDASRKFFEATQRKHELRISDKERELAHRYGATLTDAADIKKFYEAMRWNLPHDGNLALCRLGDTTNAVVEGFFRAGKVNSAANAIGACRMLTKHPLWADPLEKEILTAAFPLLKGEDLIAFAAVLSMQSLMQLSVMLGYQPSAKFDAAVEAWRKEQAAYAAAEEEERRRRNYAM